MIKYRYALDENQNIVSIDSIVEQNKGRFFTCGECGERLAPRAIRSAKTVSHFYHPYSKNSTERECNGETYLHWISKELLAESLQQDSLFFLKWKTTSSCSHKDSDWGMCYKEHEHFKDLTKEYPIVSVEKKDGDFIPDILLSNKNGDKIYIEICNSSVCSTEKRNSGNKIIEIKVKSEEDIERIIKSRTIDIGYEHLRNYCDGNIELINFDLSTTEEDFDCEGKCLYLPGKEQISNSLLKEDIAVLSSSPTTIELKSMEFISEQAISFMEVVFDISMGDDNSAIIEVLNQMWYFYQAGIETVKNRTNLNMDKLHVLYRSRSYFTFFTYKKKYYGAVFLEYKYFIFNEYDNKIFIIGQSKGIESASETIDEMQHAF